MSKFCPYCNSSISDDAKYCPVCYKTLPEKNQNETEDNYPSRPSYSKARNAYYYYKALAGSIVFLVLGIVLLITGIVFLFINKLGAYICLGFGVIFVLLALMLYGFHKVYENWNNWYNLNEGKEKWIF